MFTPWNVYPVECESYSTGAFFYLTGALCAMRFAVCYMKVANFLKRHEGLDVYDYDTQFNPLLIGG